MKKLFIATFIWLFTLNLFAAQPTKMVDDFGHTLTIVDYVAMQIPDDSGEGGLGEEDVIAIIAEYDIDETTLYAVVGDTLEGDMDADGYDVLDAGTSSAEEHLSTRKTTTAINYTDDNLWFRPATYYGSYLTSKLAGYVQHTEVDYGVPTGSRVVYINRVVGYLSSDYSYSSHSCSYLLASQNAASTDYLKITCEGIGNRVVTSYYNFSLTKIYGSGPTVISGSPRITDDADMRLQINLSADLTVAAGDTIEVWDATELDWNVAMTVDSSSTTSNFFVDSFIEQLDVSNGASKSPDWGEVVRHTPIATGMPAITTITADSSNAPGDSFDGLLYRSDSTGIWMIPEKYETAFRFEIYVEGDDALPN